MGKLVYIMGKSGTGKSRSMKNIPADQFGLINPEGKDLPFGKDAPAFRVEKVVCDKAKDIVDEIHAMARKYKIVVVDDFQTVMTNEFMRRSAEKGYDKWTDIGKHAWEIAEAAKEIPDDCILYVLCHTEENDRGGEKIKTLGKLLDDKVVLESKATIVLKTGVEDGKYFFCTQNSGNDTVKAPEGMFPSYAIQNDLKYVDDAIRNYYDLPGAKSDAEMAAVHADAKEEAVKPSTGRKSRTKKEKPAEAVSEARTREEIQQDNQKKVDDYQEAVQDAIDKVAGDREGIPIDEAFAAADTVPAPELEEVPRRKRASRTKASEAVKEESEPIYLYIPEEDNYVKIMPGDKMPSSGRTITEAEFHEGVARIAKGGVSASATTGKALETDPATDGKDPLIDDMNQPEEAPRTRRRRTRG